MPATLRRNLGWIGGVVIDGRDGRRVAQAQVTLNHVVGGAASRRMTLYDENEYRTPRIITQTDQQGRFGLAFGWDPIDLGDAMGVRPTYRLTVQRTFYPTARPHGLTHFNGQLARVLNLRAIANGSLPDAREPGDLVGMAVEIISEFRNISVPSAFVTVRDPSPSYYSLFGLAQIRAQ